MIAKLQSWIERRRRVLIAAVLVASVTMIALAAFGPAKAADKGGKPKEAAPVASAEKSWTGFGVDVHGALPTGTADFGGPVDISMSGQMAGMSAYYNHQFGVIVLGLDAGYDRVWGDLHSFGVDYAITLGLRAGVLATNSTLIYVRGEWLRAAGSGNHLDGWGMGTGIEVRVKDSPVAIALEYMHDWMNKDTFGPSVDVSADRVTARLRFDLYSKPVSSVFADR